MSDIPRKNKELLEILAELVEKHPEQRFGQILLNYGFVARYDNADISAWEDDFYKDSRLTLNRVKRMLRIYGTRL